MKFIMLLSFLIISTSCTLDKKSDRRLGQVVRAFSGHLYINYHRYSKRPRKDNVGKFKGTWPLNPRAHDPHDKPGVRPMKMD